MKVISLPLYLIVTICFCATSFSGCQNNDNQTNTFPILVDSLNYPTLEKFASVTEMNHGSHHPYYIGKLKDTIQISHIYVPPPPPPPPLEDSISQSPSIQEQNNSDTSTADNFDAYLIDWRSDEYFKHGNSADISIQIDTTQLIANIYAFQWTYPVILTNQSTDTLSIGHDKHIPIITEAQTRDNLWRPIEKKYIHGCGVGLNTIILPPNEIVLTSKLIYKGDFKTKMRIRFGKNISNEFVGSISETQFKNDY